MAEDNDKQAAALIAALAPKIAEAIIPQLTEQVETQVKGLKDKNDELLDKLANMKKDAEIEEAGKVSAALAAKTKALIDAADKQRIARLDGDNMYQGCKAGDAIKISRSDARSVAAYRDAKALAEKEGVPLEIVADE
jgi:poly-gamma-glutamate capsule biosynthesis protein CapA/YwtB (metallophosphatase superfamily)